MALAGTLKDFSLADIFQLIGLQKKTGVLTLTNDKDEAHILFMNGLVVGADTSHKLENQLGHVLVKSNLITREELEEALQTQRKTLQRLGQVLIIKGFIQQENLSEALQIQTLQIIYRLFRWSDGSYHFQQEKVVDFDQENFTPITSESILMEGVRMLDEWPMIEKRIPNFEVLLEKTEKGEDVKITSTKDYSLDASEGKSFDDLLDDMFGEESSSQDEETEDKLDRHQESVLQLVDGRSVVQDIIDRSGMNEFETCRILLDLLEADYIREATSDDFQSEVLIEEERHIPAWVPVALLAVLVVFSFAMSWNPGNRYFPMPHELSQDAGYYDTDVTHRLNVLANAIDRYYIRESALPVSLETLVRQGYAPEAFTRDPLGRKLRYQPILSENQYELSAQGFAGDNGQTRSKTFAALDAEPEAGVR